MTLPLVAQECASSGLNMCPDSICMSSGHISEAEETEPRESGKHRENSTLARLKFQWE